jgi:hypothetical protein
MLATEEQYQSPTRSVGFGIAGLNSRESRAQRGNPIKSIVKFSVFVNFANVSGFKGGCPIGQ